MARFCPYCGKQLSQRSKFCSRCGKAVPARNQAALAMQTATSPEGTASLKPEPSSRLRTKIADAPPSTFTPTKKKPRSYPPALELVGFGLRYGAWMFDFLLTLIAIMTSTFIITALSRRSVIGSNLNLVIVAALTLLLFVINFVVLAGRSGQTVGMRILGIRIVRVDGKPFTIKQACLRHLIGYPISMAVFCLGFLWMLWDRRQQGWHDKLARTVVVASA
jgi:uncharacterized RDD family membrane protein YckC